jgi:hypothetical protein
MKRSLYVLLLVAGLAACTKRPVEPTRASRRVIDSTFQKIVTGLQPEVDSACKVYGDSLFTVLVDSMMKAREAEMQQLVK